MSEELSETGNERITQGGNMTPFDQITERIRELYDEAKNWADGSDIENDDQDTALDALDKALLKAGQEADALREAEKAPLDEQVKAIQAKFHPLIGDTKSGKGQVVLARAALSPIRTRYKTKKAAEKAAAALVAQKAAEEERRLAKEALEAASGNLEATEQAEQQAAAADMAERAAKKANKAATTGLGLRTRWVVKMTNQRDAVATMWKLNPQSFLDLAQELAEQSVRNGTRELQGFEITEEKVAN